MKLSEMSTEQMAPVLCDLAEPLGEIAMDQETVKTLREIGKKRTQVEQFGSLVNGIVPLLLKTHFDATCRIVSALSGKPVEQVKAQRGFQTIKDMQDIFDAEFIDFFKSLVPTERTK